ncbi:MAG: OmpA family protein [Flavobacteriales bacterium]|nr:OmpA family protein [Flavobacteriales bacterium]
MSYGFDEHELKGEGKGTLNLFAQLLKDIPTLKIEIRSHTDSKGPSWYNHQLSRKRSAWILAHLETQGIGVERMKAIGLGETNLVNGCANEIECSDFLHQQNRRTEIKLIGKGNRDINVIIKEPVDKKVKTHVVKLDQTVWSIGNMFSISINRLVKLNKLIDYKIFPGDVLLVE